MSIFKYLRTYETKKDIHKIENKYKLFFYNLKIIKALRNQKINIICFYNTDLIRNAGNCLFKMLEINHPYSLI